MQTSIKEQIDFLVTQVLLEIRSDFKWNEFKKLQTQRDRESYLIKTKTPALGEGSSRITFLLSNRYVLKLAIPSNIEAGIAQNKEEVDVATDKKSAPAVVPVYDFAPDYSWIVSEVVRELENEKEFSEVTGVDFKTLTSYLHNLFEEKGKFPIERFEEEIEELKDKINNVKQQLADLQNDERNRKNLSSDLGYYTRVLERTKNQIKFHEEITNNPLVEALVYMIKHKATMAADLDRIEHWGKTASGKIVLLDYGYSREVAKWHYGNFDDDAPWA